jgi:hypothetical protein
MEVPRSKLTLHLAAPKPSLLTAMGTANESLLSSPPGRLHPWQHASPHADCGVN